MAVFYDLTTRRSTRSSYTTSMDSSITNFVSSARVRATVPSGTPAYGWNWDRRIVASFVAADSGVRLAQDLLQLIDCGVTEIVIDLSDVSVIEPATIAAIASSQDALRISGGRMYVLVGNDQMLQQLYTFHLAHVTPLFLIRKDRSG